MTGDMDHLLEAKRGLGFAQRTGERDWNEYYRAIEQAKLETLIDMAETLRAIMTDLAGLSDLNDRLGQILEEVKPK